MTETTIVRENLMTVKDYTPYCGNNCHLKIRCTCPRTMWIPKLNQFKCPHCGWISQYPDNFITRYKEKWHNHENKIN